MNVLLGMQHTPNGITAGQLRELRDEGLRVMSIVDDEDNDYGSGYKGSGGLTEHGKWLIRLLPELGIILDLPANQRTALDILELIWREGLLIPVMASHSGCKTVYASPRNLSDEIMSGIARLNGYYGIPLISSLIATQHCGSYLEEFTRHVKHAVRQIGPKRVGIGSGCPHIDMTLDEAREHFEKMVEMLGTDGSLGEYFPDRPMEAILCGSTLFRYLEQALQSPSLEFSEETIRGICGENFERFLHRSLPRV